MRVQRWVTLNSLYVPLFENMLARMSAEEKSLANQYSPRPRRASANSLAARRLASIVLTRTPDNAGTSGSNPSPSMEALLPQAHTDFVRVRIR